MYRVQDAERVQRAFYLQFLGDVAIGYDDVILASQLPVIPVVPRRDHCRLPT